MGRIHAGACYRELGRELRKCREAAGLTGRQLSMRTDWSEPTISRIEAGRVDITEEDVLFYLGPCRVYLPKAKEMLALCRDAQSKRGYWLSPHEQWREQLLKTLIFHEASADRSTAYEPQVVHGLLQTPEYVRALIGVERWRGPEGIDRFVEIRLHRQRILHVPHAAHFIFFLHEQALRLEVGNPAIMHEQMLKLVFLAALNHVTIRVVLASAELPAAFGGPFRLLEYAEHRPLVYLDNITSGLFLEDPDCVTPYRMLVPAIADVALDRGQSREWIAALASEYDRRSERHADGHRLEEEQLQPRRDERLR
jgi:transcriptional regulator with XRE-family HTH domain